MHDELKKHIVVGDDVSADFEKLNSSRFEKIVLSCEAFDGMNLERVKRLRDYVGDNPVEIIYYVRRWTEQIPSWWRQEVMMGDYMTFPEFFNLLLNNPNNSRVNALKVWENYEQAFGRRALRLVSFSNLLDRGVDLFKHFCEVIVGLPETPEIAKGLIQHNVSPSMADQEILRALNYVYFMNTSRRDQSIRIKLHGSSNNYDLRFLHDYMKTDIRHVKLDDNGASLRALWNGFAAFKDRLVSPEYGSELFERRSIQAEYVGQNYLLRPGALREVMKLYDYLLAAAVDTPELRALQAKG
jgi:hypothetical protein